MHLWQQQGAGVQAGGFQTQQQVLRPLREAGMAWGSEEPKGWHGYSKVSKQGLRGQARWSHSL